MRSQPFRRLGRFEKWILGLVAAALVYQLVVPPIVGQADNGDFQRVTWPLGMKANVSGYANLYWLHVNRKYTTGGDREYDYYRTSQRPVVRLALLVNEVVSKDGLFDIVVLGCVHAVLYLIALYGLLRFGQRLRRPVRYVLGGAVPIVATEVGYVSFFNSFYMESASLVFFCLTMAAALTLAVRRPPSLWVLAGYFAAGALFLTAKTQNVPLVPFLAAFGVCAGRLWRRVWPRLAAVALAIALCVIALWMYQRGNPEVYKAQILWNTVFRNILPDSPDPAADLRELGLEERWTVYIDRYSMDNPVELPLAELRAKVGGMGRILRFYARHPKRCLDLFRRCAEETFVLRVDELGNFTRESGMPPRAKSKAFSFWSDFREAWMPKGLWFLGAFFGSVLVVSGMECLRARSGAERPALLPLFAATVALMAMAEFFVVVITDGVESLVKHLWLFNFLCDVCLVAVLLWLTSKAAGIAERLRDGRKKQAAECDGAPASGSGAVCA